MGAPGPSGARRRLGTELRRLRVKAALSLEDVAGQVPCSTSKLSRLETGKGVPKLVDVHRLIELYQVGSGPEHDMLVRLVHDGRAHGWWESYTEGLTPERFVLEAPSRYTALEDGAETIAGFSAVVLHGLLQTPAYAEAVLRTLLGARPAVEIERLVALRVHRQRALTRVDHPLRLSLVIDEVVLARRIGSAAVMAAQLAHVRAMAAHPQVDLRVLALSAPFHRAHFGQFSVLGFPAGMGAGDVVFMEGQAGDTYLEEAKDVVRYREIFTTARAAALDVDRSRRTVEHWHGIHAAARS